MKQLPPELAHTAAVQQGALHHQQLTPHGWRVRDAQAFIDARIWQRVSSRVVATYSTPLQRRTALWAAAIHHERVGLTGAAALEWDGLEASRDGRIELIGPRGSRALPFSACRISVVPEPQFTKSPGPPRTSVAESVARASGNANSTRQATFFITWAVQRRLVTVDEIHASIEQSPRSATMVAALRALEVVEPGVHSIHEFDFARECKKRGLPKPLRQVPHRDSSGNLRYTDVEFHIGRRVIVVEIDGLGHLATEIHEDDNWRENELSLTGATVLRVSGFALRRDPEHFFAQLGRAIAHCRA